MQHQVRIGLVDDTGQPFGADLESVLRGLAARLQREFPQLRDDSEIADVLEQAGRRIVEHERRHGAIDSLRAFAWVAVRNEATSRVRRGAMRIARASIDGDDAETLLTSAHATVGTPEQIEADILMRELLAQLTPEERLVCVWKRLGLSSKEIAEQQGTTVERVNTFFHRVKQKIRDTLRPRDVSSSSPATPQRAKARTA
jgi:RNA polymerase sigma factor (sigma-70 family)